jgi:hypothetical protein
VSQDSEAVGEPTDGPERSVLLGWLAFHRNALGRKCSGLTDAEFAMRPTVPSRLSLLGLMRHLTEMERVYAVWALGPAGPLRFVWGDYSDGGPEWDFDADASMGAVSRLAWAAERSSADVAIDCHPDLNNADTGNGRSVRWNLQKLIGEYARHNGHADVIREQIDGATGE